MADVDLDQLAAPSDRADRLAALEQQVARLANAEAARGLLHDYAQACDTDDADAVGALFLPDATLWAGDRELHGDEILGFYRAAFGVPTCHIVGTAALNAGSDSTIASEATFLAVELAPAGPQLRWGTYTDDIVVRAGAARFATRRIRIDGSAAL